MESIWKNTVSLPRFEELQEDKSTDVLIIGGGIAGILSAYLLKESGVDCMLVEKDNICGETTGNTTAKITYQHGLIYNKIAESYGILGAKHYLEANKAAFNKYAELCREIDCDYELKDNYVYSVSNRYKLEKEMNALDKIGFEAELCETPKIPIKTVGAVKFRDQAQFHPLKFISAICKDLNIYENTFVREMVGNTAVTDKCSIKAQKVIVATHFPFINKHGLYPLKLYQHRSYVLALDGAADVNGMYVDESDTGLSFRNYQGLLLLGGGGHRTGKKGGNWNELRSYAHEVYPSSREMYYWAAQDCMSLDSIPYIGQYSASTSDLYVASGFNKWGMTGAMTAAMILCDMILERENAYADVFNPSRSILKPQLFVNACETITNLLTPTAKRCPHLGCALKWNGAEHSWDCACHGSRFTEQGSVINNPANGNLKL